MKQTILPKIDATEFGAPSSDAPDRAARFLKSIAHRDRLRVLCCLFEGERPVNAIEVAVGASQSAVSQHLARLRDEGIVASRREGRQVLYRIADPTVIALVGALYERFCDTAGPGEHL